MVTDGKIVGDDVGHIVGLDFVSRLTHEQKLIITIFDHHKEMYDVVQDWRNGGEALEYPAGLYLHMAKAVGMPDLFDERVVSEV